MVQDVLYQVRLHPTWLKGYTLEESVRHAKAYLSGAIGAMLDLGQGSGPMDHGYNI